MRIWVGRSSKAIPKELSLIRNFDKVLAMVFVISLIACLTILAVLSAIGDPDMTTMVILISAPFFLVGLFVYIELKKWIYIIVIIAAGLVMYLLSVNTMLVFFMAFTLIGAAGVVGVVVLMQRYMFYRVVRIVEYVNVKDKLSIGDKIVVFFFNIPKDLDTRSVTMNYNLKRASIPWNEMVQTISLGLMIGMFLWLYLSMNPAFMDVSTITDTPAMMFMLVLFIPLLVLPWSIFKSLNVRVETRYRDFTLYDGVKETLKRMAVPIFASFLFVFYAINDMSIYVVLTFITLSVVFNVLIIGLTSFFFYHMFEASLVDDIVSKWKVFRPVAISMDVGNDMKMTGDIPGTPKRDLNDYGVLEFAGKK